MKTNPERQTLLRRLYELSGFQRDGVIDGSAPANDMDQVIMYCARPEFQRMPDRCV